MRPASDWVMQWVSILRCMKIYASCTILSKRRQEAEDSAVKAAPLQGNSLLILQSTVNFFC